MKKRTLLPTLVWTVLSLFVSDSLAGNRPEAWTRPYDIVWTQPSSNAGESMPCGGGDIGLNVWVENGDLLCYVSRSGTFDELNGFPKLGRIRLRITPDVFDRGDSFEQRLNLKEGCVTVTGRKAGRVVTVRIWTNVFSPVVHLDVEGNQKTSVRFTYENWRRSDRALANSEKEVCRSWLGSQEAAVLDRDSVAFDGNGGVLFYHRNRSTGTGFDLCLRQQGLKEQAAGLYDPARNLVFGGRMGGNDLRSDGRVHGRYASTDFEGWALCSRRPAVRHRLRLSLHTASVETIKTWQDELAALDRRTAARPDLDQQKALAWWKAFWERSFIRIDEDKPEADSVAWQVGRNYNLFRYQLGCNAFGRFPTKFNGGLFTYDPVFVDAKRGGTPDFRRWGGGSFTAQNQRLVYWPMLRSGDEDMMKPQFEFYRNVLPMAELRSKVYWNHGGACFPEQIENFGLATAFEYGWKRPTDFEPGVEHNDWVEYSWETILEFCQMILETERYEGADISAYLPLIESSVRFFDEHYQMLSLRRTTKALDADGHLVFYPSTAAETYKMAYNPVTLVCGLKTVLTRLLELDSLRYPEVPSRAYWRELSKRIPPIYFREMNGRRVLAPALHFERINNTEIPQLYPVFPWGIYGVGKPDLSVAVDTWHHGVERKEQYHHQSWHQDNIFTARLGLADEAARLARLKLGNAPRRFPTFWGPGNDWVPDHNWGGSGMIGLQEMLMQTDGRRILLFPAWPLEWDVTFRLKAPYGTTVDARLQSGRLVELKVWPESRRGDVELVPTALQ